MDVPTVVFFSRQVDVSPMSALPDSWSDPDSRPGLLYELGWLLLCVLVFGALAVLDPFFVDVDPTTETLVGSLALGTLLGVGLVYVSVESERIRGFWDDLRRRFVVLFVFIMAMQGLLRFLPTWTVLSTLAACLTAIPVRLFLYYGQTGRTDRE